MKQTAVTFRQAKGQRKLAMLTAYDATVARLMDDHVDAVLVGDSLGMVMLGQPDTLSVTMDQMIHHSAAVSRGLTKPLLVCDMPFMSYHLSPQQACANAGRLVQEGRAQAVKLEGGRHFCPQVEAIVRASIPVMGHLGLTPQSLHSMGGYKVQGRGREAAQALLDAGLEVRCCGVPGMPEALPAPADFVILPFPALQGERLRGTAAPERTAVFACCRHGTRVYGGGLSPLRQALLDCGAEPVELFGTEPLTTHNAVPTAEGAIALAVLHSPYRLHGAPCLVIGYGHIGRVLANKLHGLSARVTVAARRPSDRAMAEAFGLEADETGRYARGLAYHFVFNTVPAPVLTQDQLAALLPGCLLVELASAPGGIPACTRTDVTRIDAPGLPGKFCAASAGAAYVAAILEQEGAFPA